MLLFKSDPKKLIGRGVGTVWVAEIHRDADNRKGKIGSAGDTAKVPTGGAEIRILTDEAGVTVTNNGSTAYHVKTKVASAAGGHAAVHEGTLHPGHNFRLRLKGTIASIQPAA